MEVDKFKNKEKSKGRADMAGRGSRMVRGISLSQGDSGPDYKGNVSQKEKSCNLEDTDPRERLEELSIPKEDQGQGQERGSYEVTQGKTSCLRKSTKVRLIKKKKMSERQKGKLNRSMEKSFEDLLTGLDDDLEPDIDDIFTNCDYLPETVTDDTINAMAYQRKHEMPSFPPEGDDQPEDFQFPRKSRESDQDPSSEDDENLEDDFQFPTKTKNTDPGIQSDSEEESDERQLEFVSSREEEEEAEMYDSSKLMIPTIGESNTDDTLLGNVELEDDDDEEQGELDRILDNKETEEQGDLEQMVDDKESIERGELNGMLDGKETREEEETVEQKDLTLFSGLDQDDSDPDIDKLIAECGFLPESVTDATINAMVDKNKPLAKSYSENETQIMDRNAESSDDGEEETMETDSEQEEDHSPEVKIRIQKEPSLDFSVLEPDSSHLDVHIGKQKTNLRKQGSLAKRRKPTRSNVRSALLSGEETMFQDHTEPQTESSMNNDDKHDDVFDDKRTSTSSAEGVPTSPPAKKPSKVMVPLPGFGGPKPEVRKRSEQQHESEMAIDETPKKDFRSYGVKLPVPQPKGSKNNEEDGTFDKPVLRKVAKPRNESKETGSEKQFEMPSLKSVSTGEKEKKSEAESDKMFDKPALRQVSRDEMKNTKAETESMFEKPALRNVSRPSDSEKPNDTEMKFEKPALRQVSRDRNENSKPDREHDITFTKPQLKNTQKPYLEKPTTPKSPEAKTFEIPALRHTPKVNRTQPEENETHLHTFEKPALRNVSRAPVLEKRNSLEGGAFEKPTLRNVSKPPLPEKRISVSEEDSDEKHKFDIPALRLVPKDHRPTVTLKNASRDDENSEISQVIKPALRVTPRKETTKMEGEKREAPSWLKNMKLRKTKSQSEDMETVGEKESEKPSWLQAASEKREKVLETISSKENQSKSSTENKVPWLDRGALKKTPTPLQENNDDNVHSNHEEGRKRLESVESNGDTNDQIREKTPTKGGPKENYVPSWMKHQDNRHKSTPNLNFVTPSSNSDEAPDWKKAIAERRRNRKESIEIPVKKSDDHVESGVPPWRVELAKKGMKSSTPVKVSSETRKTEPEWKQKADEKRQRIINTGLFDKTLRKT